MCLTLPLGFMSPWESTRWYDRFMRQPISPKMHRQFRIIGSVLCWFRCLEHPPLALLYKVFWFLIGPQDTFSDIRLWMNLRTSFQKNSNSALSQHFGIVSEVSFEVNELASAVAEAANATGHPTDSQPARLEVEVAVSNHDKVWHLKGKHWNSFWKKVKMSSKSDKTPSI